MPSASSSRDTNGSAAAALVAAALAVFTFGVLTYLLEVSASWRAWLNWRIGGLGGKQIVMLVVWIAAWGGLHWRWRQHSITWKPLVWTIAFLLAGALVLTFPPVLHVLSSGR